MRSKRDSAIAYTQIDEPTLRDLCVFTATLAMTADEAVSMLPAGPTGRHKRTLTRLYTLVNRTAGQASSTLELGEELVHMHEAKS